MSSIDPKRDAVTQPQDELNHPLNTLSSTYPTEIAGPGGRTTNVENNERGILQAIVERKIALHQVAELGSDHDSYGVGIYAEGRERFSD